MKILPIPTKTGIKWLRIEWNKLNIQTYFGYTTDYKIWEARFRFFTKIIIIPSIINTIAWYTNKSWLWVFNAILTILLIIFTFGGKIVEREYKARRDAELEKTLETKQ